jgi:PhzF family phenazine biosynthesis protein
VVDGGGDLPFGTLQRIAREFNQAETTFVLEPSLPGADWRLRSLTMAGVEVFGAGHNALGAWWWLASSGRLALRGDTTLFRQQIGDHVLPVTVSAKNGRVEWIAMEQGQPVFGNVTPDVEALARALGLAPGDIASDRAPCQVVSTGAAHLMVPIANRSAVDRVHPNTSLLLEILKGVGGEGSYVFSLDPGRAEATAYSRSFNPVVGIPEDPATGSAAGPLAAYLVRYGLAQEGEIGIEQGTAIGRTSIIRARVTGRSISIAGAGIIVASGQLHL